MRAVSIQSPFTLVHSIQLHSALSAAWPTVRLVTRRQHKRRAKRRRHANLVWRTAAVGVTVLMLNTSGFSPALVLHRDPDNGPQAVPPRWLGYGSNGIGLGGTATAMVYAAIDYVPGPVPRPPSSESLAPFFAPRR